MLSSTSLIVRKPNCCCYQPYSSISNHHRMAPINAVKPTFRTTTIKFSQYCRILPHVLRTHQSNQPSFAFSSQLPLLLALQHPCVVCCVTVIHSLSVLASYRGLTKQELQLLKHQRCFRKHINHIKQQTDLKGCRRSRAFKFSMFLIVSFIDPLAFPGTLAPLPDSQVDIEKRNVSKALLANVSSSIPGTSDMSIVSIRKYDINGNHVPVTSRWKQRRFETI